MAEHASARTTWFVTLTYGGGYQNPDAYHLDVQHLDEFYKALRRRGYKFRPVGVGEYGGKRNRAHWHVILFWYSDPPDVPMDQRFHWKWTDKRGIERWIWSKGTSQCEYPRSPEAAMSYVLSYLDKPKEKRGEFSFGKRPAIGEIYLRDWARNKARKGFALFPTRLPVFQVEGNVKDRGPSAGQPYDYWLDTQSQLLPRMIDAYAREWLTCRPGQMIPWCPWIEDWAYHVGGELRDELEPDQVRLHFGVLDKLRLHGAHVGGAVRVHTGLETDTVLLECVRTGAMMARWFDEDGSVLWQESVGERPSEQKEARRRLDKGRLTPAVPWPVVRLDWPERSGFKMRKIGECGEPSQRLRLLSRGAELPQRKEPKGQ